MKKLVFILLISITITACENSEETVPAPPPVIGNVFEVTVDFNAGNNYAFTGVYPQTLKVYPSDVVLVYLLETTTNNGTPVWSLMPQTFYLDGGGIVEYNYNYTKNDFQVYLSGNVDLNTLSAGFTQNQTFRIAVLPADFATNVNVSNLNSVIERLKQNNKGFKIHELN